jgi:hypothetical protein
MGSSIYGISGGKVLQSRSRIRHKSGKMLLATDPIANFLLGKFNLRSAMLSG